MSQMVIASLQIQNTGVYIENKNAAGQTLRGGLESAEEIFFVFESL